MPLNHGTLIHLIFPAAVISITFLSDHFMDLMLITYFIDLSYETLSKVSDIGNLF